MALHEEKVAIVTGASAGLGYAIVEELVREGAKVTMVARTKDKLENAAEKIRKAYKGAQVIAVAGDITNNENLDYVIETTLNEFKKIDYLVNNAGYDGDGKILLETSMDEFRKVLNTNVVAVASFIQKTSPIMIKNGGGSIVNISSNSGNAGVYELSAYSTAKHAVIGLTKNAGLELGPEGVRVNGIAPGGIKTNMLDDYLKRTGEETGMTGAELEAKMTTNNPLRRFSTPKEQADVVSLLLSDKTSYINGETVTVDGGQTGVLSS